LAAIRLHAQVLQSARSTAESQEAAQDIVTGVDKASRMIAQLLTLARLEPNAMQAKNHVDLVNLIQSTVSMLDFQFRQAGIDLQLQLDSAPIYAQPEQLEIMLRNLLENAVIYRHPELAPIIKVSCGVAQAKVFLQIEDNGIGMDPEQIPLVFQRFYRINQASAVIGSGLGLSIVKQIVDSHQGNIEISAAPSDIGLVIRIEFATSS